MQARLDGFMKLITLGDMSAAESAKAWDDLNVAIRKETLLIIRQRRRTYRATLPQKLKRLFDQEKRIKEDAAGVEPTVDTITDLSAAVTLNGNKGVTPLQRVRSAITDCIRAKMELRRGRLYREAAHFRGKTTKPLFRRVSTKYADNTIHRLDAADGTPARGVHDKADTLADAWTPIFQQVGSSETDRTEVLQRLGDAGQYREQLDDLASPITEAEVAAAIGASSPGKACGPGCLGNDWYRDFSDQLIAVLTTLYNSWTAARVFPQSFQEADIFCLKKGGDATNPLNYRPLALLDSDDKILTRVLATRTSAKLHWMIHPNQKGFVPFRVIHDTIDLFRAAQVMAAADPDLEGVLALLLDFRKAYDSVDREYMYNVLRWLGFPEQYVHTIEGIHPGTRVRFIANGNRSRWVTATCGIRQGCPLAPLLFILVLEALYRRTNGATPVTRIVLRSQAGSVTLKVAGYADDTACYVRQVGEVTIILLIARKFAAASGLVLNEGKTLIIALNASRVADRPPLPPPLKLQATAQLDRYLGIQVGSTEGTAHTWQLARTQLITRLALAGQKTMTIDQRSPSAIIIPKLFYIARHCWPSASVVAQFQMIIKHFIWNARFTIDKMEMRAWLSADVATMPRPQGGLAIPDLRLELLAMAAAVANKWPLIASPTVRVVGDILASPEAETSVGVFTSPLFQRACNIEESESALLCCNPGLKSAQFMGTLLRYRIRRTWSWPWPR